MKQLPYQAVKLGLPGFWDHSFPSPRPTASQGYRVWPTYLQIYAPTSTVEEEEIEEFYEKVQHVVDEIPRGDVLYVIGDWNAKVERTRQTAQLEDSDWGYGMSGETNSLIL